MGAVWLLGGLGSKCRRLRANFGFKLNKTTQPHQKKNIQNMSDSADDGSIDEHESGDEEDDAMQWETVSVPASASGPPTPFLLY